MTFVEIDGHFIQPRHIVRLVAPDSRKDGVRRGTIYLKDDAEVYFYGETPEDTLRLARELVATLANINPEATP